MGRAHKAVTYTLPLVGSAIACQSKKLLNPDPTTLSLRVYDDWIVARAVVGSVVVEFDNGGIGTQADETESAC